LAPNHDVDPGTNSRVGKPVSDYRHGSGATTGDGRGRSSQLFRAPTTTTTQGRQLLWDEYRRRYDAQYSKRDGSAMQLQAQLREFDDDDDDHEHEHEHDAQ
jgi:hypothetical protein